MNDPHYWILSSNIFEQCILLFIVIFIPFLILMKKWFKLAIYWFSLIITVDIFNSQYFLNLTALKVWGILLIPWILASIKKIYKQKIVRLYCFYLLYLSILGIYFAYLNPWIDLSGLRSGRDLPSLRVIMYLGSVVLEMNVAIYFAQIFSLKNNRDHLIKAMIIAGMVCSLGLFLEKIFHFDFYYFMTRGRSLLLIDRMRGFNYEPRGAAQSLVYAILFLMSSAIQYRYKYIYFFIFFMAFILTVSTSGIISFALGFLLYLFYFRRDVIIELKNIKLQPIIFMKKYLFLIIPIIFIFNTIPTPIKNYWKKNINDRNYIVEGKSIPEYFEVFDSAALNFLSHNPKFLIFGVGPGLSAIPSSDYVLEKDVEWKGKINPLPHTGIVLTMINGGLVGLMLLIIFYGSIFKYLYLKKDFFTRREKFLFFILPFSLYWAQVRPHYLLFLIGAMTLSRKISQS